MSRPSPRIWARHFQDDWQARAGDRRLPHWLRVAALAYGSHSDNGHARFKQGEVALILGSVDHETGEVRRYANVGRAVALAVEYGWLEDGSYWGCLIVPAHSIKKGEYGSKSPCPLAAKHSRRRAKPSLSERFDCESSTPSEWFEAQSPHSASGLQRGRLLSVLPHPQPDSSPVPREAS